MAADLARGSGSPRRLAIDVPAVANLVGTLAKYLGLVVVFPIAVALWYREPVWPFLVTGLATSGVGYALERVTPDAKLRLGVREGFLVVSATLLMTAAFASLPYLFVGGEQLDHPIDAYLEGMSGCDDDRRERRHRLRRPLEVALDVAPVHAVARRDGDHHPRRRDPAAAARRRPTDAGDRAARPGDRRALRAHPRDRAAALGPLHRADRGRSRCCSRRSAGSGSTTR